MKKAYHLKNLQETQKLAHHLAKILEKGNLLLFFGDLGTGKTTFIRSLIHGLVGQEIVVSSPTFTLMQTYESPLGQVWHIDLYRLQDARPLRMELEEILYQDIALIEWPERFGKNMPPRSLNIYFSYGETPESRHIIFEGNHVNKLKDFEN